MWTSLCTNRGWERGESSIPRHDTKPKEAYGHAFKPARNNTNWSQNKKKKREQLLSTDKDAALVHTQKANQKKLDASKESKVKSTYSYRINDLICIVKRFPPNEREGNSMLNVQLHAYPLSLADSDPEGDSRCAGSGITTPLRYVTCQSIVRGQQRGPITGTAGQIYDHLLSNIGSIASIGGQGKYHTAEVAGMRGMGTRGENAEQGLLRGLLRPSRRRCGQAERKQSQMTGCTLRWLH